MGKIESADPVEKLANDYTEDLRFIREFDLYIITDVDLQRLTIISGKYGLDKKATRDNAGDVLTELSRIIQKKFEELAIEHILERLREESPRKMPRKQMVKKEKSDPAEDWKG